MFLAQSPAMQRQGCSACHLVEFSCDACHTKHGTDLSLAREPGACGVCHMGPDHPQVEMWETSRHGVLYKQAGKGSAPSCVTCHMQAGSHNVSRGISAGLPKDATGRKTQERDRMLTICSECHTKAFSARNLADADKIEEQSSALVDEAKHIIEGLQKDGLLSPSPAERPAHPLFGKTFVIGPHMLYENLSFVESLFFKMKSFYAITAYKGAFHQNPDYAHWYGNAPLKLTLSEIKSEADLLRRVDNLKKRLDNLGPAGKEEQGEFSEINKGLRELNEKRLKGEIREQEYMTLKSKLLEEKGL
jgi:hydroxylamine dehydrogenase